MTGLPGIGERLDARLRALGYVKFGRLDVARFCVERSYRPQYLYAWLSGRTPTYDNLLRLASDLQTSVSWLAVGDETVSAARQTAGDLAAARLPASGRRAGEPAGRPAPASPRSPASAQILDFRRLRDVTNRLVELEAQLAAIFEAFPDLYIWVDGQGRLVDWKGGRGSVPDALGGACQGRPIADVFGGDTGARLQAAVTLALREAQPASLEYAAAVEGAERCFEARLVPLDPRGTPRPHVLIVVRDITDRLVAERAVRESETRYRALVEGSIQAMCIIQDGVLRFANRAYCDVFDHPAPDAVVGLPALSLVAPAERARVRAYREARLAGQPVPSRYEFQGQRRDGTTIWVENVATVVSWDGRPATLVTLHDVTERKRAQAAAAALADAGRELAAALDVDQVLAHVLSSVTRLCGVARANVLSLEPDTGVLRCVASVGSAEPERVIGRTFAPGEGVVALAVTQGAPASSPDILNDPRLVVPEWAAQLSRSHGFSAVLAVPLRARDRVIGALVIADLPGRVFTPDEIGLLTAFADHAAVALDNAFRFRAMEERLRARGQG